MFTHKLQGKEEHQPYQENTHFKHIHTPTQTPAITETKRMYDLP